MSDRTDRIDAASATTGAFTPQEPHTRLAALAGRWSGLTKTWLDPSAPPEETPTEASIESILGGRFLRIAYAGTCTGKPHAGEMIVSFHVDAKQHELAWIDSFHTGLAIMSLTGPLRDDGIVEVLGSYAAGDQRWGWCTELRSKKPGQLVIASFNIPPGGAAEPAVETTLLRR